MFAMQTDREPPRCARHAPRRSRPLLAAGALVALLVAGGVAAGVSRPAYADEKTVEISNFSFVPAQLTVPVGTTVTWVNKDEEPHTIVDSNTLFKSHALDTGDKFSFTFTTPGSFKYFCTIHAHMVGTIVVQ
jgi:plastocyanin